MSAISIRSGRTRRIDFAVTDSLSGDAINLTGATLRFTAKYRQQDSDSAAVINKDSAGNGITVTNAAGGLLTVEFEPEDTVTLLTNLTLRAELAAIEADGDKWTLWQGDLIISQSVLQIL